MPRGSPVKIPSPQLAAPGSPRISENKPLNATLGRGDKKIPLDHT